MEKIDLNRTYLVDGKHKVLGIFHDISQRQTLHEYLVVWLHLETDAVHQARTDSYGRNFGHGIKLVPVKPYVENFNEYY